MAHAAPLIGAASLLVSAAAGAGLVLGNTTIKFLLFKRIPGRGEIFKEVSEKDLQPGDILLFRLQTSSGKHINVFKHAAVYCGSGEVIHFLGAGTPSTWDVITNQKIHGLISKTGYTSLKRERGKCEIYRKKDGVNLNDFYSELEKAMNSEAKYSLYKNNCIHFALSLLGLEKFYSDLVEVQDEGDSSRSETIFKFRLFKRIPEHGNIFEEVPENKLQRGDIVLFLLESSSQELCSIFRHAAVYCGDGEVIQFRRIQSSSDLTSSGVTAPALVTKEGLVTMKKKWGKFKIYHKTDGVALNVFCKKVREAMNNDAEYDFMKNNCIHFALSLLGLEKFYSELVEFQDEDDSSRSGGAAIWRPPSPVGQGSSHTA